MTGLSRSPSALKRDESASQANRQKECCRVRFCLDTKELRICNNPQCNSIQKWVVPVSERSSK